MNKHRNLIVLLPCLPLNRLFLRTKNVLFIRLFYGFFTVAACLLLQISDTITPQQAINCMRELRGSGAIQTLKVRPAKEKIDLKR